MFDINCKDRKSLLLKKIAHLFLEVKIVADDLGDALLFRNTIGKYRQAEMIVVKGGVCLFRKDKYPCMDYRFC